MEHYGLQIHLLYIKIEYNVICISLIKDNSET